MDEENTGAMVAFTFPEIGVDVKSWEFKGENVDHSIKDSNIMGIIRK